MAIVITRHTCIKLIELILVCILIGCYYENGSGYGKGNGFLASGTFLGYLIILVGVFAGGMMGTPINRRVDLFYCLVGCALFIAVGAIGINEGGNDKHKAVAWISIIEGIVFFLDAILVFRNEP